MDLYSKSMIKSTVNIRRIKVHTRVIVYIFLLNSAMTIIIKIINPGNIIKQMATPFSFKLVTSTLGRKASDVESLLDFSFEGRYSDNVSKTNVLCVSSDVYLYRFCFVLMFFFVKTLLFYP